MTVHSPSISAFRHDVLHSEGSSWLDRDSIIVWLLALVPATLLIVFAAFQPWIEPADLFRDPLAVAELKGTACCKVYDGAISSLGVIGWMACAALCLFAAALMMNARNKIAGAGTFFIYAGLFTAFLGFDDLFLIHENVLPAFGVPERVTYGAYGLIGLGYLATSWRLILQNRYVLFGSAIALLATSVVIDWFLHSDNVWRLIAEDGAKFVGISLWASFHVDAVWRFFSRTSA